MKSVWNFLIAPSKQLTDPIDRRKAQLASSILIPYTILILTTLETASYFLPGRVSNTTHQIGHLSLLLFSLLYGVSRTRYFKYAGLGMVSVIVGSVFSVAYFEPHPEIIQSTYTWLSVAIVISGFVLPLRWSATIAAFCLLMIGVFAFSFPVTHFSTLFATLPVVLVMSVLTLFAVQLREKAENELRKGKEKAELANRNKSQFLASMSHEIRSPLGVVLGFADLLTGDDLKPEDKARFREMVHRNGEHILSLVNEILDLTRVETNRLEIKPCTVDLRREIEALIELHRPIARRKGIEIELRLDENIPDSIVSDALRLRQALHNLLANAIKFTEHGVVTLLVRRYKNEIKFVIDDTGSGISPYVREHLFEPFVQGEPSRKDGSGLGLALSLKLARLLGGDLKLDWTEPGKGSRFVMTVSQDVHPPKTSRLQA